MRAVVLGLAASAAAIVIPATPVGAQAWPGAAFAAGPAFTDSGGGVTVHHGMPGRHDGDRSRHRRGRDDRRDRDVVVGDWGYGGEWALYNNRSFEPDSYNDWWHDRPDRAFPRWMQNNENCERVWWSGGGWRC